jgi:taurine dioxygenase
MTITSSAVDLQVTPLSATIGAEIRGVDLKQPLAADVVAGLRAALLQHKVIFFPAQHLAPAEHVAFARNFGELTPAHPVIPGIKGFPEVFEIDYTKAAKQQRGSGAARDPYEGLSWHTDVTFVENPPLGSILNALVIPPAGGDTMFSDQRSAYEALSEVMREFLDRLVAVHDGGPAFGKALAKRKELLDDGADWEGKQYQALKPVEHPVIRTHPETGCKSLFVNPGFTSRIKGLTRPESDNLLRFLYDHSTKPQFTVRYHWHAGDLGFWDNRVTQHSVVGDFAGQHRVIQRVTLRGDKPVS